MLHRISCTFFSFIPVAFIIIILHNKHFRMQSVTKKCSSIIFWCNVNCSKYMKEKWWRDPEGTKIYIFIWLYALFPFVCVKCTLKLILTRRCWYRCSQQIYNEIYRTWQFMVFFPEFSLALFLFFHFIISSIYGTLLHTYIF